jgi:hypothetical protein
MLHPSALYRLKNRPTPCPWGSCPALLNSWALLEKHLHHAHLHPGSRGLPAPGTPVKCNISNCNQVFGTSGECHQHCLSGHMGMYGARCPFSKFHTLSQTEWKLTVDCAYEGPSFDELMAHIGRRHRKATPDDFVPGLIHHFPPYLPPASALPKLPTETNLPHHRVTRSGSSTKITGAEGKIVKAYEQSASPSVVNLVAKLCFSGHKPLPDSFVRMKGALAAIGAIVNNAQRERLSADAIPTSHIRHRIPGDPDAAEALLSIQGSKQDGLFHSSSTKLHLLDTIDVDAERKRAEREARAEIKRLVATGHVIGDTPKVYRFWTRSHSGESDVKAAQGVEEKSDAWCLTRRRQRSLTDVVKTRYELSDDSDSTADDGESSAASASSLYTPQKRR